MIAGDVLPGAAKSVLAKLYSVRSWPARNLCSMCPEPYIRSLIVQGLVEWTELGEGDFRSRLHRLRLTEEGRHRVSLVMPAIVRAAKGDG